MKSNIPELRFPEFKNEPEWEEKPLSKVGEIITGNTPPTANLENYGGSELFVSPADISDKRYITTTKTTLSEQGFKQTRHIKANSILFVCIGSTIGKVAQNKFDCATNQQINSIVPFDEYSNDFVYSALENSSSRIASLAGNHAVPIINKTLFSSVLISCPLLSEQQKIADCLSSIDNLITAQSKKVEALKEHKKGLMQHLFPQDGEKVPKLRFPEFENDWASEELGKLGKFLGGGTPSKLVDEYWHGTVPWISSSDLNEDNLKTIAITRFINEKSISESATKLIPKGSVLFISRVGTGKLAINSVDLCTSQDFTNFIPTQIHNYFLGYYFLANKSALTSLDQGTSIKGFSKGDLEKIKLIYPKQKEEQQKIADCLSSIDELITSSTKKVETLKEHKKGLMQKLFPSVKEL